MVVFVVRKGNPKHITGWDQLTQPGVSVITPNPSTSGSARWNIMAAYGAELKEGKSPTQALAYLKTLSPRTSRSGLSASTALATFTSGKGDVLLDYESDAIAAEKAGDKVSYVIPKQTILIQTPIAVTAKTSHATQANAFLKYQWSAAGQKIWAQQGYRPVWHRSRRSSSRSSRRRRSVHDRLTRRLDQGQGQFFDPLADRSPRSNSPRGIRLPPASATIEAPGQPSGSPAPSPGRALRAVAPVPAGWARAWRCST